MKKLLAIFVMLFALTLGFVFPAAGKRTPFNGDSPVIRLMEFSGEDLLMRKE